MESPKTQSIDAVKSLLAFIGRASDPLPAFVELSGGARLILSKKKDVYYTTLPTACSCPAAALAHGQVCEHRTALLAGNTVEASRTQAAIYQQRQRELRAARNLHSDPEPTEGPRRLARPPEDSIKPAGKWPSGHNGPVLEVVA